MTHPRLATLPACAALVALLLAGCAPAGGDIVVPPSPDSGSSSEPEIDTSVASYSSAEFDGAAWTGGYESAFYYAGGNSITDPTGNPYFQVALPSFDSGDGRQLTISLYNFPGGTGSWEGIAEVLLSSPDAMQGYQYDEPAQLTDFVFEITSWEPQADGSVIFSAEYGGTLAGLLGSPAVAVTNGVITDLVVTVFTEPF
ncbi:MAG: hypothetical protein ABL886_10300 [Rhodoglobus sp.]